MSHPATSDGWRCRRAEARAAARVALSELGNQGLEGACNNAYCACNSAYCACNNAYCVCNNAYCACNSAYRACNNAYCACNSAYCACNNAYCACSALETSVSKPVRSRSGGCAQGAALARSH